MDISNDEQSTIYVEMTLDERDLIIEALSRFVYQLSRMGSTHLGIRGKVETIRNLQEYIEGCE